MLEYRSALGTDVRGFGRDHIWLTCVAAASSLARNLQVRVNWYRLPSSGRQFWSRDVATAPSRCQQNTSLFGWAQAHHTNKVEVLVSSYFPRSVPVQQYLRLLTNARAGSNGPARCRGYGVPAVLLNNN